MNRVVTGLLMGVGAGAITGSVVLLMRGEKTQRFLRERWQQLRSALPAPEHVQQYAQHVAEQVSQAASEVKDTAQQAVKQVRDAGSELGELAQQKAMPMKQTGQDGGANIKELVKQG
jgi:gas vesicle protein